jgi:prolyl 4-hydroxylase
LICSTPRLYVADDFATASECQHVLRRAADPLWLAVRGVETSQGVAGLSCELPVAGEPVLESLTRRTYALLGLDNDFGRTLRFRRYLSGEYHPAHLDQFQIGDAWLVATALLYLTDTAEGGETYFPQAQPEAVSVAPRLGRLAIWFNHLPTGEPDPAALHEALPVAHGEKATLGNFIYKPLSFARVTPRA